MDAAECVRVCMVSVDRSREERDQRKCRLAAVQEKRQCLEAEVRELAARSRQHVSDLNALKATLKHLIEQRDTIIGYEIDRWSTGCSFLPHSSTTALLWTRFHWSVGVRLLTRDSQCCGQRTKKKLDKGCSQHTKTRICIVRTRQLRASTYMRTPLGGCGLSIRPLMASTRGGWESGHSQRPPQTASNNNNNSRLFCPHVASTFYTTGGPY